MSVKSNLPKRSRAPATRETDSRPGASQRDEPRRSDEQRREAATRRAPKEGPGGLGTTAHGGYPEQQPTKAVPPAAGKPGRKRP